MDVELKTKKAMAKNEVDLLVDLIKTKPILNTKETNATTNKIKEDTWTSLTSIFNARTGSIPRTKQQLKSKWDNLKKSARKRSQQIRMNNLKNGDGKRHYIPPDDILEKVSWLLGSTCSDLNILFGGDAVCVSSMKVPDVVEAPSKGMQAKKRKLLDVMSPAAESGLPKPINSVSKGNGTDDGSEARNLAIQKYFEKKTEMLDLKHKILKLELAKKEREIHLIYNIIE